MNEATNDTTLFVFFKSMVAEASGLTIETVNSFRERVGKAFDMGEPVWMIAEELKLRAAAPPKTKTPRSLAIKVTYVE